MIKLYGIPNCDTVKKARIWLADNGVEAEFADFKKSPPTPELITAWLSQIPLENLLNKRGTTWRKLDAQTQARATEQQGAVRIMVEHPSVIKRPVLEKDGQFYVGYSADRYQQIFG
ncbi:arsenate reductase [Neisseria weixii]|uniref:Arsenate reductase n=1 Tax=Neisseria weixii TaxID=1853276 RepID=A0A3N4NE87_9NEIS|nr:arsenate reductase [Neisseria weixii]ATD65022.1 arsenate reductase [Neisseria weixii]RPD90460.1 arsenate reductase [Neisseria weixii]RPD90598.1 arsenate reductase [Neisseria weixii]